MISVLLFPLPALRIRNGGRPPRRPDAAVEAAEAW
jgi:hypothetical protein